MSDHRSIRECTVCGEKVTASNATPEWEARHSHGVAVSDLDLDAIEARVNAATPGPWEAGDWWHIQGAKFCPCRADWGPAIVQQMNINGARMEAHRHRRAKPIDAPVINTEPYSDGFPRSVVITTDEYGAIDPANAEFIAHAITDVPALIAEVRRLRGLWEQMKTTTVLAVTMHDRLAMRDELRHLIEREGEWPAPVPAPSDEEGNRG